MHARWWTALVPVLSLVGCALDLRTRGAGSRRQRPASAGPRRSAPRGCPRRRCTSSWRGTRWRKPRALAHERRQRCVRGGPGARRGGRGALARAGSESTGAPRSERRARRDPEPAPAISPVMIARLPCPGKEMSMSSRNPTSRCPPSLPWCAAAAHRARRLRQLRRRLPVELVDARRAYNHAHDGPANSLVPAQVIAAQQALARAEESFTDAPDAQRTRGDLAYVAQRRAADRRRAGRSPPTGETRPRRRRGSGKPRSTRRRARRPSSSRRAGSSRRAAAGAREVPGVLASPPSSARPARRRSARPRARRWRGPRRDRPPSREARGMVITLNGSVLFATGRVDPAPPSPRIGSSRWPGRSSDNPGGAIVVEGHTADSRRLRGGEERGAVLAARRGGAATTWSSTESTGDRIAREGGARLYPPHHADNRTPEGRANNPPNSRS